MKSREISRSKIGPFSLACTDPYTSIGWEYQSRNDSGAKRLRAKRLVANGTVGETTRYHEFEAELDKSDDKDN